MIPTQEYGNLPTAGVEIEVVEWKGITRSDVCKNLIGLGYMSATAGYQDAYHDYHCKCEICSMWTADPVGVKCAEPIQVALTYDGSLPQEGGEFITSPFPVHGYFMSEMQQVLTAIGKDANWTLDRKAMRGDKRASPSIHIHTSVFNPYLEAHEVDFTRLMYGYYPELFALACSAGIERGLHYRKAITSNMGMGMASDQIRRVIGEDGNWQHHLFLSDRQSNRMRARSQYYYHEWRMFEAAYDDWPYVAGAIYFTSALSQLAFNYDVTNVLDGYSRLNSWYNPSLDLVDATTFKRAFDPQRLKLLERAAQEYTFLKNDPVASEVVRLFVQRVM